MDESTKKSLDEKHREHIADQYGQWHTQWRTWGSWWGWGTPVGLGLGWALFVVSSGVALELLHLAGLLH